MVASVLVDAHSNWRPYSNPTEGWIELADLGLPPGTHYRLTDRLGILKRTAPLTDNHLDLSGPLTGIYCLWLLDGSTKARVARVVNW